MTHPGNQGEGPGEDKTAETLALQVDQLAKDVETETGKLKFYADQSDDLVEDNDRQEIELVVDRMNKIHKIILTLISQIQERKIKNGEKDRDVRQWKKEMKSTYNPFLEERDKLIAVLKQKQAVEAQEKEKEILRAEEIKLEPEKKRLTEINQRQAMFEEQAGLKRYRLEKEMWEEKYKAKLAMVEKKLKAEKISHQDQAKLPKLQSHSLMEQQLTGFGLKTCSSHKLTRNKFLMKSSLVIFLKWYVHTLEQELPTLSQVA